MTLSAQCKCYVYDYIEGKGVLFFKFIILNYGGLKKKHSCTLEQKFSGRFSQDNKSGPRQTG